MPRYFTFLRAINVGGHVVKMDQLRKIFESLGFSNVETFIASGNVIFATPSKNIKALEKRIQQTLRDALGYDVATFIRTEPELNAIATYKPFPQSKLDGAVALNIVFLADALDATAEKRTLALRTDIDELHVNGREIYWLCRKKQSESTISSAVFNKALGVPGTVRGAGTIKKMAEKYACSSS